YLIDRGITEDTIKNFGLGYANRFSDDLYKYLKSLQYEDELLKQTGLISFDQIRGGHDKFWDRIMFPIMDAGNKVVGFGGRVMGEGMPKYLNSPETVIFDKSRILYGLNIARKSRESYLLISEGYMDVLSLHQAGFTNAVAALGTAFTEAHANLLKRYTKEVILTFDNDAAGTAAALRAIPILRDAGLTVKVVDLEPYKDPDDFIKSLGAKEYKSRIERAKNSFFFEIDKLQDNYNMDDPEDKTKFFNEIAKKLLGFTEELERNFYLDAVAKEYNIDAILLERLVNKLGTQSMGLIQAKRRLPYKESQRIKGNEEGIVKTQKLLITWLADDPIILIKLKDIIKPEDFDDGIYADVVRLIYEEHENGSDIVPAKIISHFESSSEQSQVAALFNSDLIDKIQEDDRQKALYDTIYRLKEESLEKLSLKAIENNDTELLQNIIRQKNDLKKNIVAALT
ncbi:MAG: DNA primase, partial [Clostridiales bacterium]|nr:DNA primase [Clostridiales bacterium]